MKHQLQAARGMTLAETMITMALVSVLGLLVYSLLNLGTILGAKNSAVNVAHQSARMAMLQMTQDFHCAASPFVLVDTNGNTVAGTGPAEGVAFHLWGKDTNGNDLPPYKIKNDAATGQNKVHIVATAATVPVVGQWLIVPTHEIEEKITAVSGTGDCTLTLANNITTAIEGTGSGNIACFVTDRVSYTVVNGALQWSGPTYKKTFSTASLGQNITNAKPFTIPTSQAGAPLTTSVAAIDLSTADNTYSNRGFKAANILLEGQVPARAMLTQ
jgi:prepilin-type N-terminal cleavage/methylation domain-containing protein